LRRNNSTAKGTDDSSGRGSTSLVPPPNGNHQAHILAPPSPLRQSAVPVRLTDKSTGKNEEGGALDAPMTRSASHDVVATRGSKRRQSSAGPTFEGGEDEDDVAKRLRRALTASIPHGNPSSLAPASPKRRAARPATRYATRSAPNSPPQESSELFDTSAPSETAPHPAVNRVGRALRRTMSHDALPEGQDSGALNEARTKDVHKHSIGLQEGIAA
jgi:hypothetical protein